MQIKQFFSNDLVNSTIVLNDPYIEELALPLYGTKRKLTRELLVNYFGVGRLKLSAETIEKVLSDFTSAETEWQRLLKACFFLKN